MLIVLKVEVKTYISTVSVQFVSLYTDVNLIYVPATQYVYINAPASLKCASEYDIDNVTWVGPNSEVHNGTIEHVTLESEGQHNCKMTIMGTPKDWLVDVFVIGQF